MNTQGKKTLPLRIFLVFFFISGVYTVSLPGQASADHRSAKIIGLNIGSKSLIGIDILFHTGRDLNFRLGANYMDLNIRNHQRRYGKYDRQLAFDGEFHLSSLEALVEKPFYNGFLRIVGGLAFFYQNEFALKVALAENTVINDLELTPEEVGYGRGTVRWNSPVSPYLGIGIGRAVPRKKWSISGEIGAYFKGKPSFQLEATNLLRTNERSEDDIEEKLGFVFWYPVMNIRIGYLLN